MRKFITNRKNLSCILLTILVVCLQSLDAEAQMRVLRGIVKDSYGEALIGATVKVKGAARGVSTGIDGRFQLSITPQDKILVFSSIGYTSKEVAIGSGSDLNVVLTESASTLNEVVVDGYMPVKKSDLTGSVGSVKMNDILKAPVKSFDEALAGRIAGVQVTSQEGQPGSNIEIVIRGYNSINQTNTPLYVIDGFPMEDPGSSVVNPLNSIDPNDIESIDILKDASATAIYGSRGANGVVVITTKRGKEGKPVITYNGYYGFQQSNKRLAVLSPYEFVKLQNEIDPVNTANLYGYLDEWKDAVFDAELYRGLKGINWEDQVMRTAGMYNNHIALAGGTEKTKYNASLSHINQDGIIINSGFRRAQGRFSLDQEVSDKLKIGFNSTYSDIKYYGTATSSETYNNEINLLFSVWAYRPVTGDPTVDLLDVTNDPEVEQSSDFRFNPVLTAKNELRENYTNSFTTNAFADYLINKNLKLRVAGGISRGGREVRTFNNSLTRSGNYTTANKVNGGKTIYNSTNWQNTNTLTFNKTFNKNHSLVALAGMTMEGGSSNVFGATAILIPNESLGLNGLDEGNPSTITSFSSDWKQMSFLSRVNYTLKSKYLFTASVRADGSSRFLGDNRWGVFPSAAFAWRLGSEEFLKQYKFISNAKLRSSWGITGNNQFSNYAAYPGISIDNSSGYGFGNNIQKGSYASVLGNSNLKWESTEQIDLGIDLGFFNERLTLAADVYRKNTYDLLLNADQALSTGYERQMMNIGKVRNEGLELTLGFVPVDKKFRWSSELNISFNRNKVVALADNQSYMLTSMRWGDDWVNIYPYIAQVGSPIAQVYGYIFDGVYSFEDFDQDGQGKYTLRRDRPANGEARENINPGDIKYKDLNGDLLINDSDRTIIAQPYPVHTGGFNNNFTYKGFDLNVFFQWSYGNDIINANRQMLESGYKYNTNQFASYANRWSPENPDSDIPAAKGITMKAYSTRIIEDGSYLRLKTVALGYTLPKNLSRRMGIGTLRVYTSAQNLYTWTNYSGYDPEVSVRRSALTPGFDYSAYPRAKTLTFGLNATF